MSTTHHLLRSRLNELFPERLSLDFGVEVMKKKGEDFEGNICILVTEGSNYWQVLLKDNPIAGIATLYKDQLGKYEILGKPVELADVLRAIEKVWSGKGSVNLDMLGPLMTCIFHDGRGEVVDTLLLDLTLPVKDWDEPTLTAILKLIE